MDQDFKCRYETHEDELIMGFCINQKCSKPSQFCFQCLIKIHQDHPGDCIRFNQLTLLISQYIQAQNELINNYKDLQNQLKRTFETYFKRMESDIKILIEMDQQLKNRSYITFKEKISYIKEYDSRNKQNQSRCLLIELNEILEAFKQISELKEQEKQLKQRDVIEVQQKSERKKLSQQQDNQKAQECYQQGNALYNQKLYQDAILCYDQAIKINPNFSEAFNGKGIALSYLKLYQDAILCYDQAIKINPNFSEAFNNKGRALSYLKLYQDALNFYDTALQLQQNPTYMKNKADALFALGNKQESQKWYTNAQQAGFDKKEIQKQLKQF